MLLDGIQKVGYWIKLPQLGTLHCSHQNTNLVFYIGELSLLFEGIKQHRVLGD